MFRLIDQVIMLVGIFLVVVEELWTVELTDVGPIHNSVVICVKERFYAIALRLDLFFPDIFLSFFI
ncbi:hypothetical protein [Telluribacter humicola]|uniref:hypothetical protein n=1 Tax=Telluribacter humicola TaxID=1720261 RepID=UPI001A9688EC|nr:hypothetical protein [Telluribacter humicola]